MKGLAIRGLAALQGEAVIHGGKNAALPLLCAALLTPRAVLEGCPQLTDLTASRRILEHLGCLVTVTPDGLGDRVEVDTSGCGSREIPAELAGQFRGSILFLGAMLGRFGEAHIALPGGCRLGPRPIDLHLEGLARMGVETSQHQGMLHCTVPGGRLHGAWIPLRYPSVGATENLLLAGAMAQGETVLEGAAREPEIDCLAAFLQRAGVKIQRQGEIIRIEGCTSLQTVCQKVIPDRIEALTYLCGAAATGGRVLLRQIQPELLASALPPLQRMGCEISCTDNTIALAAPEKLLPVGELLAAPYPAFPTDGLAPMMIPALLAKGRSRFEETVFSGRYYHAEQLARMGASIRVEGKTALVEGVDGLRGAHLRCTDLRGGAALLLAALAAEGDSLLDGMAHLERGYAQLVPTLRGLGAQVKEVTLSENGEEKDEKCPPPERVSSRTWYPAAAGQI